MLLYDYARYKYQYEAIKIKQLQEVLERNKCLLSLHYLILHQLHCFITVHYISWFPLLHHLPTIVIVLKQLVKLWDPLLHSHLTRSKICTL
jgi:hypothetical protein